MSVRLFVRCIVAKWPIDMDAVWGGRSDGSRNNAGGWVRDRSTGGGNFGDENVGRPTLTNGEFAAYLCENA